MHVPREIDIKTKYDGQVAELAVGAFPPCTVICWEKHRRIMARCKRCSEFQDNGAGSVEGISEQGIIVATVLSLTHLGFDTILPCGYLSYPAHVCYSHPNGCSHFALPLTGWAFPLLDHSSPFLFRLWHPVGPLSFLLPSPTYKGALLTLLKLIPSVVLLSFLLHINLTCLAPPNGFRTQLLREGIVEGRGRATSFLK